MCSFCHKYLLNSCVLFYIFLYIPNSLSLYQIAVWDSVYLLDVLALKKHPNQASWKHVIEKLFCNKNVLKLGK